MSHTFDLIFVKNSKSENAEINLRSRFFIFRSILYFVLSFFSE